MLVRHRVIFVVASIVTIVTAVATGCTESSIDVGARGPDASTQPSFRPEPDAGDASSVPAAPLCIGTECPYPYATCSEGVTGPVYKCQNNLLTDHDNCGACGTVCPFFETLGMRSRCIQGVCEAECFVGGFKDCNGRLEDGCEAFVGNDSENCGACGNKCPPGVHCRSGVCGCPTGTVECDQQCVDLQSSTNHCGTCSNVCPRLDGAAAPPHSEYACVDGKCGRLRCIDEFIKTWADCNGDLELPNSDGCERDVGTGALDPNNCGGCGVVCGPNQVCREIEGTLECICKPNETICGPPGFIQCADLSTDPLHCGACGYACPSKDDVHQITACRKGMCAYECAPGWSDCNDNPLDGCETNVLIHGANCGACGRRCDTAAGQPCIQGVCHEVECDGGGPR